MDNRPTAHGSRVCRTTWRGCLRSQRSACSVPRHRSSLFFTDIVPGQRPWLRNVVIIASQSRGVRPARASPRIELADRPRSTGAPDNLAWLSSRPTRGVLHLTPLDEARFQQHRARSAAIISKRRGHSVCIPWRAACMRIAPWRTERPPTERSRAGGLGVVVFAANTGHVPPHGVGGCSV